MDNYNKVYQTWEESSHPSEDSKIIYGPHNQEQYDNDDYTKLTIYHDYKNKVSIFKEEFYKETHYIKVDGLKDLRTLLIVFNIIKINSISTFK